VVSELLIAALEHSPAARVGIGQRSSATICAASACGDDATVTQRAVAAPEN
jgi:hypothetical protein